MLTRVLTHIDTKPKSMTEISLVAFFCSLSLRLKARMKRRSFAQKHFLLFSFLSISTSAKKSPFLFKKNVRSKAQKSKEKSPFFALYRQERSRLMLHLTKRDQEERKGETQIEKKDSLQSVLLGWWQIYKSLCIQPLFLYESGKKGAHF